METTQVLIKIWCTLCQKNTWFILTKQHGLTCLSCRAKGREGILYFETMSDEGKTKLAEVKT